MTRTATHGDHPGRHHRWASGALLALAAASATASASLPGGATNAPVADASGLWARRVLNPGPQQLLPLTVVFSNGPDQTSFTGRDLTGLSAMPLAINLAIDGTADPFRPLVTWATPAGTGDVDFVQIVLYNDDTNLEVNRITRPAGTTSFQFSNSLPASYNLVVNIRLIDLEDDNAPFDTGNILRQSRAYMNYTSPVPEPAAAGLLMSGLAGLAGLCWRRRRAHTHR